MTMENRKNNRSSVRKRVPNACTRCRQQKIKCRGGFPCEQCTKRKLNCNFDDRLQKVLVTKSFISDLEAKVAFYEKNGTSSEQSQSHASPAITEQRQQSPESLERDNDLTENNFQPIDQENLGPVVPLTPTEHINSIDPVLPLPLPLPSLLEPTESSDHTRSSSPEPCLMNPFALGASAYTPASHGGMPVYLGTSSNWAFGRRVLIMSHEQILGGSLPQQNLFFQSETYDLGWDGTRGPSSSPNSIDSTTLPTADHAIYLINAVKFHCGQMFHLFDEESFMRSFSIFHDPNADKSSLMPLWYVHYLLILAFGKAFLARSLRGRRPPGSELFVQAMKLLPDTTFLCVRPVETIEILCCACLYLQSLDYRSPAYTLIGQALRIALEHGMNTDMQSQHIPASLVRRCRNIFWTVYVLDRQLSALMGVPSSIRDADISAELPHDPLKSQKAMALDIQVKLSRVIAQITNNVYGPEGRLDVRYVSNTKEALKDIANVTDQLHQSFDFVQDVGISRLAAYLHLLHHQCIILATRPLLFTFLEARLHSRQLGQRRYGSVKALLRMCLESSFQNLKILAELQEQGLLECFLSFDLDATFSSTVVLLMAASIDPSLLGGDNQWTQWSHSILDEMKSRGNLVAGFIKAELQQLEMILSRAMPPSYGEANNLPPDQCNADSSNDTQLKLSETDESPLMDPTIGDATWQFTMTTDQLMEVADSLNVEGFDWSLEGILCS